MCLRETMEGMSQATPNHTRRRGLRGSRGPRVLILPAWTGPATYVLYAAFSVVAFVAGVPSLDLSTPEGYRPFWALALVLGSVAGLVGFVGESPPWNRVELAGSLVVVAFAGAYLWAIGVPALEGDQDRQANAILILTALIFPLGRMVISARYEGSTPKKGEPKK